MKIQFAPKPAMRHFDPDFRPHVDLIPGCRIDESPVDVALEYMNNLAYLYGISPAFRYGSNVMTFGLDPLE